jgi:hypothetical protein
VGVFAGAQATGLDDAVLRAAAEGQLIDGGAARGVAGDVMDLAVVALDVAAQRRTTAILGIDGSVVSG